MIPVRVAEAGFSRMFMRVFLVAAALLACGCTRDDGRQAAAAQAAGAPRPLVSAATAGLAAPHGIGGGFAKLPDRGDLVAYPGNIVRRDGAYTWYRTELSEEHALRAIAGGHLRVTTPEGEILDFAYDRHVEHASGDWTWIGHRPGHEGEQTILTFGAQAVFGSIAQPGKPPLRLAVRDGASWLVETDPAKVAGIVNAATRPRRPDYHIVPESELPRSRATGVVAAADGATTSPDTRTTTSAAATAAATTVDLIIGYTGGFATAHGGTSGATTRLNYLVDVANAAYGNSKVSAQVRLVKAMKVTYTDTNSNDTALEQLSGYKSGSGPVTPNAAFNALRAAREQYGADLVSLVRDFRDPEQDGCGLAWLLGGSLQKIEPGEGWDELGYSVVGDGTDVGSDGKSYYCLDETLAHELGHNMGAAHDKETSKGDDGVLDNPDDYGAYSYSFGYKSGATTGNFYTVMAYGDSGQIIYRTFSTPLTKFCGGRPCGSSSEDNAKTLINTIPAVAGFRAGGVAGSTGTDADFDGSGQADVFWRNPDSGDNVLWLSAEKSARVDLPRVQGGGWIVAATGDFDGNGKSDIVWRSTTSGDNVVWPSANRDARYSLENVPKSYWAIVGAGDFDGDGTSDLLWRNSESGDNVIWPSARWELRRTIANVPKSAWRVVGIGDFDADGRSDLLWRNLSTGDDTLWPSADRDLRRTLPNVTTSGWAIVGIGDFDGDGAADVLWRNSDSGDNIIWPSADRDQRYAVADVPKSSWMVATIGDFDGDGQSDVFWRNTATGDNTVWPSANRTLRRSLANVPKSAWAIMP